MPPCTTHLPASCRACPAEATSRSSPAPTGVTTSASAGRIAAPTCTSWGARAQESTLLASLIRADLGAGDGPATRPHRGCCAGLPSSRRSRVVCRAGTLARCAEGAGRRRATLIADPASRLAARTRATLAQRRRLVRLASEGARAAPARALPARRSHSITRGCACDGACSRHRLRSRPVRSASLLRPRSSA